MNFKNGGQSDFSINSRSWSEVKILSTLRYPDAPSQYAAAYRLAKKVPASPSASVQWDLSTKTKLTKSIFGGYHNTLKNLRTVATSIVSSYLTAPVNFEVRQVPGVMTQIILHNDEDTEIRLHVYDDCSETYVHNHGSGFLSYCLSGRYDEKIWNVVDDSSGRAVHILERSKGGQLTPKEIRNGALELVGTRCHFAGNALIVMPEEFHSIASVQGAEPPVTLIFRDKSISAGPTYILSETPTPNCPTIPIRPASPHEQNACFDRIKSIFQKL
jgi:hypothetical protein